MTEHVLETNWIYLYTAAVVVVHFFHVPFVVVSDGGLCLVGFDQEHSPTTAPASAAHLVEFQVLQWQVVAYAPLPADTLPTNINSMLLEWPRCYTSFSQLRVHINCIKPVMYQYQSCTSDKHVHRPCQSTCIAELLSQMQTGSWAWPWGSSPTEKACWQRPSTVSVFE